MAKSEGESLPCAPYSLQTATIQVAHRISFNLLPNVGFASASATYKHLLEQPACVPRCSQASKP